MKYAGAGRTTYCTCIFLYFFFSTKIYEGTLMLVWEKSNFLMERDLKALKNKSNKENGRILKCFQK